MNPKPKIIFFGTPDYSVLVLEQLLASGMSPELIVTMPDRPAGKKLEMTSPPAKVWAKKNNILCIQPESLKDQLLIDTLKEEQFELGVVIAYGKIIPQVIIDIPTHGILNIHGSLLPKFRGASPLENAILSDEKNTGPTIMLIDHEMDHGPILAQEKIDPEPWPLTAQELGKRVVQHGAELLVKTIPLWMEKKITPQEQNHDEATYTKKIEKQDGLIDLSADGYKNYLKIQAFNEWPGTFFFVEKDSKKIRVIIKQASYDKTTNTLTILRVVTEGKKEIDYETFKRSLI
jgi:methionyl-tRNA formyltransferase